MSYVCFDVPIGPQPGCGLCCGQGRTPLVIDRGSYSSAREYLLAWHAPLEGRGLCCPVCDTGWHDPIPWGELTPAVAASALFAMHRLEQIMRGPG